MHLDWISGVLIAFGVQSLVLAGALFFSTTNSPANRCLSLVLLVLIGMTSVYLFGWTGRAEVAPVVAFLPMNLPLALGPLLYGYVYGLVRGRAPPRAVLHLAPALLHLTYLLTVLALPTDSRFGWKETAHDAMIKPLIEAAVLVSLTAYSVAGLQELRLYRNWLVQARSDADRYGALWIGRVLIALLATLVLLSGVRLYTSFVGEVGGAPHLICMAALGAFLGVQGWRCSGRAFPVMTPPPSPGPDPVQDWSALGRDWRERTRLQRWWREPDLTLADLARRLGTNTSYLSRAINEGLGMNFNEMINRMRAEEAARRIDADEGETLMRIALEAGFSSKATFNRAFRAATGASPTERRRSLKS